MTDLISRHLDRLRAESAAATTVIAREECLRRLDRQLPHGLEEASTDELREWLGNPRWCAKTRETYWCHLVAFYRGMTSGRRPILDWDPTEEMRRPHVGRRLPRVATDDQLAHALASLTRPVLRAVILAAGVGMRAAEVADADRDTITRHRVLIHGKGDRQRSVPVPPDVWDEVRSAPSGRLVIHEGCPVTAAWVSITVSRALTAIGEPRLTLHWFRGAYATRLRRAGVDTIVISRLLGHSSVATTERYVQIVDADMDAAVARMPRLGRIEPVSGRLEPPATEVA